MDSIELFSSSVLIRLVCRACVGFVVFFSISAVFPFRASCFVLLIGVCCVRVVYFCVFDLLRHVGVDAGFSYFLKPSLEGRRLQRVLIPSADHYEYTTVSLLISGDG